MQVSLWSWVKLILKRTWVHRQLQAWSHPYIVKWLLLMQQNSWICLKGHRYITFSAISKNLFIFLYKTYVRPHLEYCLQLWCPYLAQDIDTLEKVPGTQRQATKLVRELAKLPYEYRLKELRIYSLYSRRQWGDLIETYKLLKDYYDLDWTRFFTMSPVQNTNLNTYGYIYSLQLNS